MNPEKVGKFIKKLRKDNNLTQSELAEKYGVTYQAVSKWENGLNLPDLSLIRQMSKDFNVSVEDLLDGEINTVKNDNKNGRKLLIISLIVLIIILGIVLIIVLRKNDNSSYEFKTITTTCNEFKVSGSLAYDKNKSSIYISNINYCGGDDEEVYQEIECNLYEKNGDTTRVLSSCKSSDKNIKLEEYLKDIELNVDNHSNVCKKYDNESLYLEINAKDKNNKNITYKIPLTLTDTCND